MINDPAFDIIEKNKGDVFVLTRIKSDPAVVIAVIVVAALAVSLIPIFAGAFFSHPISDDFKYARFVHTAVEENGATGFLPSVFGTVADTYMNWQGTYSAAFLFALQPGGVYSGMYFLTTFIIVGSIVAVRAGSEDFVSLAEDDIPIVFDVLNAEDVGRLRADDGSNGDDSTLAYSCSTVVVGETPETAAADNEDI